MFPFFSLQNPAVSAPFPPMHAPEHSVTQSFYFSADEGGYATVHLCESSSGIGIVHDNIWNANTELFHTVLTSHLKNPRHTPQRQMSCMPTRVLIDRRNVYVATTSCSQSCAVHPGDFAKLYVQLRYSHPQKIVT